MKITNITSEVFEWERPGIWNGGHFYGPGRLHKVTVHTDEGITGYGWAEIPWTPAHCLTTWARS